jgi:hypothetical protein
MSNTWDAPEGQEQHQKLERELLKQSRPLQLKRWPRKRPLEESKGNHALRSTVRQEFAGAGRKRGPRATISWRALASRRGGQDA